MSKTELSIQAQVQEWVINEASFKKGNKSAGTRARNNLLELMKLAKQRRVEIQETKAAAE